MIEITGLAKTGGPLTKRIYLDEKTGKAVSDGSACIMASGGAIRLRFNDLPQFADQIDTLDRNEAIALGRLRPDIPDEVKVVTQDRLTKMNGSAAPGIIARTSSYIAYTPGRPALALIDVDPKGLPAELKARIQDAGGFEAVLMLEFPWMANTARVVRRSTSSGISRNDTGEVMPASNGLHIYLLVQDGADIDRFLKAMHDRCWKAGFGWFMIGAAGQLLERSPIDRAVGAAERLVFEGPPDIDPPLVQDRASRKPKVHEGATLDTREACPQLTSDERDQVDDLKAASAARLKPEADAAREQFVEKHAEKLVEAKGIPINKARHIIHQQTQGILLPDAPLPWDLKKFEGKTARDILANPAKFIGQTMADPLEGVAYGRCKAKVYQRKDGSLLINSQAHGGKVYEIRPDAPPPPPEPEFDADPNDPNSWGDKGPEPPPADAPEPPRRRKVRSEVDNDTPSNGPIISVIAGKLHITTTEAEDAVIAAGLPVYQRGDSLVQPVVRDVPASRGRKTMAAGLGELNAYSLVDILCATATYERFDARSKEWIRINPPAQVAHTLLNRQGKWHFPVVAGIITTPTLRPDGTLLTAPGYDAATRLYHVADPSLRLHPEVDAPTPDLAKRALGVLDTLLQEFEFVNGVSKSVALSGIITPVIRGAMPVAPLHAVNAHTAGSGKSFLVDIISLISTGRICPVASAAPDEAETEKRIAGLLLAGYPIVSIDNCNGELGGDLLCQAIERPLIRIRRLGASDIFEIESSVTMFATGNNLRVRGDMVRRSLVVELDPQMERPELRKFEHDPVAAILANRGKYVSACLVIVRAYVLEGCPGKLAPIASFEGWSDLVRSALVWLGCDDPALSMEAAREDDPELGELQEMMSVWRAAFGNTEITCKAAIATASEKMIPADADGDPMPHALPTGDRYPDLQQMFLQVAGVRGTVDGKKLGTWLKSREGKIVGKDRFERAGTSDGAARWKLRPMS